MKLRLSIVTVYFIDWFDEFLGKHAGVDNVLQTKKFCAHLKPFFQLNFSNLSMAQLLNVKMSLLSLTLGERKELDPIDYNSNAHERRPFAFQGSYIVSTLR